MAEKIRFRVIDTKLESSFKTITVTYFYGSKSFTETIKVPFTMAGEAIIDFLKAEWNLRFKLLEEQELQSVVDINGYEYKEEVL